jgi:hypothetical protein
LKTKDDVTVLILSIRPIPRNDGSNLICCGEVVSSTICALAEVKSNTKVGMLLWRLVMHDLICMLVDIDVGMVIEQHVMEVVQDITIELLIAITAKTNVGCLLSIIDVELSIARISSIWRQEASHKMMETTMNAKGRGARSLSDPFIYSDSKRGECKHTVIVANLFKELTIVEKELSKLCRPLWKWLKLDLTLQAAHSKELLASSRFAQFFTVKMESMTVWTLYIHRTQIVKEDWLLIWSSSRG